MHRPANRARGPIAAALLVALAACTFSPVPVAPDSAPLDLDPTRSYVEGYLVVGLQDGQDPALAARAVGGEVEHVWEPIDAALIALPETIDTDKAMRLTRGLGLRYVERRAVFWHDPVPATGLDRMTIDDDAFGLQWMHRQLNTEEAWAAGYTGDGVRIGIHDSFVDHRHPDLAPNVFYPGFDGFTGTLITETTAHDGGSDHGTAVAGTAAAAANGIGGRGVAFGAEIVPIAINDPASGALDLVAIINGALFAALGPDGCTVLVCESDGDHAPGGLGYVHVVNMSWGGNGYSQLIKDTIDFLLLHDIVVVTSAGNTPTQSFASPAWYPGPISVAATKPTGERTDFSNRGLHVDVAAPGESIWTTTTRACVFSTPDGSSCSTSDADYTFINGTSFSSPATAGVAALVIEALAERDGSGAIVATPTPAQVRAILTGTANSPDGSGFNEELGHGVVDAAAAVARAASLDVGTAPDGASLVVDVVFAEDDSVFLPRVGLSLVPLTGDGPTKHAQTADGSFIWAEGQALFLGVDPGDYLLLASGPHEASTGAEADTATAVVTLPEGSFRGVTIPLDIETFDDPGEPNESIADARPMEMGTTVRSSFYNPATGADEDFFAVPVVAGEDYWFNVDTVSGGADAAMEVQTADGTVVASNDDYRQTRGGSPLPDPALVYAATATETVYIRLIADSDGPFNVYDLDVSVLVGSESEPNGSGTSNSGNIASPDFTNADPLPPGSAITGEIEASGEVDIFEVELDPAAYVVDLETAVNLNPDTVVVIFDSTGEVVAQNDDYDLQDSRVEFEVLTGATYYVAVSDYVAPGQGSTGPYTLSVTTTESTP